MTERLSNFPNIRREYNVRFSNLVTELEMLTRPDGIPIKVNGARVLIDDFGLWLNAIDKAYHSTETVMVPAAGGSANND